MSELTQGRAGARVLLWAVIVAFVVRVVVRWHSGAADFWVNGYTFFFDMGRNIANGSGIALAGTPTAFRVPLYPILLAFLTLGYRAFFPIIVAQSLIGAGTVWCTAQITEELFGNAAAVIAASVTAVYPYYVVHDTALQETSLYTLFTALTVVLLMRVRRIGSIPIAATAGLILGAAVLTRANLAPFALLAPLWLLVRGRSSTIPWQRRLLTFLFCAGVTALTVSPWLARSYLLTGSPTLSTETGLSLWESNNPYTFSHYPLESIDRSAEVAFHALDTQQRTELDALRSNEAEVDHWFLEQALNYIRQHPWQTLANSGRKVIAAFWILPSPRRGFWPDLIYCMSYGPIITFGVYAMWAYRKDWREHLIFYALFTTFIGVTAIFYGHTNYRTYLDLYLIVFSAGLFVKMWQTKKWTQMLLKSKASEIVP